MRGGRDLLLQAVRDRRDVGRLLVEPVEEGVEFVHDLVKVVRDLDELAREEVEIVVAVELHVEEIARERTGFRPGRRRRRGSGEGELVLLLEAPDRLEQTGLAEGKLFLDGLDEVELALEMVPLDDEFPDQVHQGVELVGC